jgi:hypothetical protein
MAQTAVASSMTRAFAGMLGDSSYVKNVRSYVSEESSAEIPFGVAVFRGTSNEELGCLLASSTAAAMAAAMLGVVVHSHAYDKPLEVGDTGIKPKMTVGVLTHGRIWVPVEDAVDPGDAVRVRIVVTGNEVKGAFRAAQDSADCVNISAFARWLTVTTGAGIALLELDMCPGIGTADT